MGTGILRPLSAVILAATCATPAAAGGKHGFADKPGGGAGDPVIQIAASIAPNAGAVFSLTPEQANELYAFDTTTGTFRLSVPPPVIPSFANGANQFIRVGFPFKISSGSVRKSVMKDKGKLASTSYLTENISVTDENGVHVPVVAVINGRSADGKKLYKDPGFPTWLDASGKNRLVGKKVLTLIASTGDQDLGTVSAFGGTPSDPQNSAIAEIHIRIHEVGGIVVNGYWVLKLGDATGQPVPNQPPLVIAAVTPKSPVAPAKFENGLQVVESFSKFIVRYSEPVVPRSVGLSASQVAAHNAQNPVVPLLFNGNTGMSPNPGNLAVPIYPNYAVRGSPNGVASFTVPFDVRPINPNNLAEYVVNPILDLPGKLDLTLAGLPVSTNINPTASAGYPWVGSAATSLHNVRFDDLTGAASFTFRTSGGRAFTNVPVAPQVLYYTPLSGTGLGAINLDGNGFETNDPATERLLLLTNAIEVAACPFGSYLYGCHKNTFGDASAKHPIGVGHAPALIGGPTPLPGINEGSTGSTAGGGNPLSNYPPGFETVCRNSAGDARLTKSPLVGSVGDVQVGDFLDTMFFDPSPNVLGGAHTSFVVGGALSRNSISDPPVPNPPPLRLPVGLPPIEIVFGQQQLKKPAFVIEGDEVWPGAAGSPLRRVLLIPGKNGGPDLYPTFPQNGPAFATHSAPIAYAARQQIGNFLYVTDRDQGVVQVLNSNTFSVISTIKTPDPEGLGLAPDLRTLYVSNLGDDTVSVVGTDPFSPFFHKEINRVKVGAGPRSVAVQPDNEDVFVCNYLGDSISIFDPSSQSIRNTLTSGIKKPLDIVLTPRHTATGFAAGVYFGFIANSGKGNVPIYESGPTGATGFGADAVRWSANLPGPLADMRAMIYDRGTPPGATAALAGGVYVTHTDATTGLAMVSRIHWTAQTPALGAFPSVPLPSSVLTAPGIVQRTFDVVGTWGGPLVPIQQRLNPGGQDQTPFGIALADYDTASFFSPVTGNIRTNIGAIAAVPTLAAGGVNSKHPLRIVNGALYATVAADRMYVSFPGDDRIEVLDPNATGTRLNTIHDVPRVGRLATYFDQ